MDLILMVARLVVVINDRHSLSVVILLSSPRKLCVGVLDDEEHVPGADQARCGIGKGAVITLHKDCQC
ncbi:MAG: hypothetical protein BME94_00250 [Methanobacteriales archaeon Met13]